MRCIRRFFIVHALRPMTASGVKDMVEAADSRAEPQSVGENGAPMTIWQVWLRRLCLFVIVWAIAEVLLGAALWGAYLFARMVLDVEPSVLAEPVVGAMAMAGACLNLAIGFLGLRGARNPRKIITLKYTQSNSVCYAKDGQVIGVGAGQQRVRGHVRPHLACERPVRHRASRVRLASARSDGLLRRASVRPPGVKKPLRGSGEAFNCGRFA